MKRSHDTKKYLLWQKKQAEIQRDLNAVSIGSAGRIECSQLDQERQPNNIYLAISAIRKAENNVSHQFNSSNFFIIFALLLLPKLAAGSSNDTYIDNTVITAEQKFDHIISHTDLEVEENRRKQAIEFIKNQEQIKGTNFVGKEEYIKADEEYVKSMKKYSNHKTKKNMEEFVKSNTKIGHAARILNESMRSNQTGTVTSEGMARRG